MEELCDEVEKIEEEPEDQNENGRRVEKAEELFKDRVADEIEELLKNRMRRWRSFVMGLGEWRRNLGIN